MNSNETCQSIEAEIREIEQVLYSRNILQEKLTTLLSLNNGVVQMAANDVSDTSRSTTNTLNSNGQSRGCQCRSGCRRVCVPEESSIRNINGRVNFIPSDCPSSNPSAQQSGTSGSTVAQARVSIPVDSTTDASSSCQESSQGTQSSRSQTQPTSNSSANSSSRCNCSNSARRLAELSHRVLARGFAYAEDCWLFEMETLLRNVIHENQASRNSSSSGGSQQWQQRLCGSGSCYSCSGSGNCYSCSGSGSNSSTR